MKAVWCLFLLSVVVALEAIPTKRKRSRQQVHYDNSQSEKNDMVFSEELKEYLSGKTTDGRVKRRADMMPTWPGGVVVYEFDGIDNNLQNLVLEAMAEWSSKTCISFIEYNETDSEQPRVKFVPSSGCVSQVGYTGGVQYIWLSSTSCSHVGVLIHEIGHTLGLLHEQTRIDRNQYVTVNFDNIQESAWSQYEILATLQHDTSIPYDVGSIMHYSPFTFGTQGRNKDYYTMVAHDPLKQNGMGRQQALSLLDTKFVNQLYKCSIYCTVKQLEQPCKNGGYVGKDCVCQCPDGLVGDLCEDLAPSKTNSESICGGYFTIDDDVRKIESPNYPNNYPLGTQCYYFIEAPEGFQVELHFEKFFLEEDDYCYWDQLFIRHDAPYYDTSAGSYCGQELEGVTLTSKGNTMMLDFNSDEFWTESGFSATFSFIDQHQTETQEENTTPVTSGLIKVPAVGGCNPLEDEEVYDHITSKNYPSGYPANSDCTWNIILPSVGYFGYIYFVEHIDIEGTAFVYCYDVLTITADNKSPESFCGQILPDRYIYFENNAVVKFKSDHIFQRTGFDLKYVVIPRQAEQWDNWSDWGDCSATCGTGYRVRYRTCPSSKCIGAGVDQLSCDLDACENPCDPTMTHHVTDTGGRIESPGYPFQYPKHYFIDRINQCFITVDLPDEYYSVTFSFDDVDIDCDYQFEYLEFVSEDGSRETVYCNEASQWNLEFMGNVKITFWVADYLYHRVLFFRGFSLTYTYNTAK